ncbi:MAG: hypothetical protein RQ736_03015 [Thiogranum sp.]|nr:hypothetical protein [Thiogranum sp.]
MKLSIHREARCSPEQLRVLLIDAAEQLAGRGARVLEAKLPWEGHPLLLVDAELHPVVVSFDSEHSEAALLNGLMAVEKLSSALAWVNQVYEALQHREQPPRLVVVSAQLPPGSSAILARCASLRLFQFKALRVNGETGLWLEPLGDQNDAERPANAAPVPGSVPEAPRAASISHVSPADQPAEDTLPALSSEETAYFQQL